MRILIPLVLWIALALTACDAGPAGDAAGIPEITREELVRSSPGTVILDVRTPEEYSAGHIQDAFNVPHDRIESQLGELRKFEGLPVVLYCKSGRRAAMAAEVLGKAGFTDLRHLTGDMDGWVAAGYPVKKDGP